jgi:hypothetical protein
MNASQYFQSAALLDALALRGLTFAHGCAVWRSVSVVGPNPKVALGPTRANVANRPTIPPVVGTSGQSGQGGGRGNSRALRHSLFCLSGFSQHYNPANIQQM